MALYRSSLWAFSFCLQKEPLKQNLVHFLALVNLKEWEVDVELLLGVCCPCLYFPCVTPVQRSRAVFGLAVSCFHIQESLGVMPGQLLAACILISSRTQPPPQGQKMPSAHCRVGWRLDLMLVYRKGEQKGPLCGMLAKWTVSLSPKEMPVFWFFFLPLPLASPTHDLHAVFS